MNSDPNVRPSSLVCIAYSSHFTPFGIECGIAFTAYMDFIRSEGTHWMYSCPKQRNELAVAGITKVNRDLKPGKFCLAMFETFPPPRSTHRQVF